MQMGFYLIEPFRDNPSLWRAVWGFLWQNWKVIGRYGSKELEMKGQVSSF